MKTIHITHAKGHGDAMLALALANPEHDPFANDRGEPTESARYTAATLFTFAPAFMGAL